MMMMCTSTTAETIKTETTKYRARYRRALRMFK